MQLITNWASDNGVKMHCRTSIKINVCLMLVIHLSFQRKVRITASQEMFVSQRLKMLRISLSNCSTALFYLRTNMHAYTVFIDE